MWMGRAVRYTQQLGLISWWLRSTGPHIGIINSCFCLRRFTSEKWGLKPFFSGFYLALRHSKLSRMEAFFNAHGYHGWRPTQQIPSKHVPWLEQQSLGSVDPWKMMEIRWNFRGFMAIYPLGLWQFTRIIDELLDCWIVEVCQFWIKWGMSGYHDHVALKWHSFLRVRTFDLISCEKWDTVLLKLKAWLAESCHQVLSWVLRVPRSGSQSLAIGWLELHDVYPYVWMFGYIIHISH